MGFGFALAGSFLGLTCMVLARNLPSGRARVRWLTFASLAIGGTGIWMMHFIAMIGFTVKGNNVKYDLGITALSLVMSIVSVAFGLFVVGQGKPSIAKIAIGGPLTGLGVVVMHYTGMAAVNIPGSIHYDLVWVGASVAIALVAATVALFFTTWVRGRGSLVAASVIMAIAVCGMHYTGMFSISVTLRTDVNSVPGVDPLLLLIPILVLATAVLIGLIVGVLGEKDDKPVEAEPAPAVVEEPTPALVGAPASSFWDSDTKPDEAADPRLTERGRPMLAARLADRPHPLPRQRERDWETSAEFNGFEEPPARR
jgi:NO-binding membrane sensor protein with MHYT domain